MAGWLGKLLMMVAFITHESITWVAAATNKCPSSGIAVTDSR